MSSLREVILGLEKKYPVEQWRVGDVYVWPYLRIKLYLNLLSYEINKEKKLLESVNLKKTDGRRKHIKKMVKLFYAAFGYFHFFRGLNQKSLIFVGGHFHRVYHDTEGWFHRFFDSMVTHHHLENDVYMLEYQKVLNPSYNSKAIIGLAEKIEFYKMLFFWRFRIIKRRQKEVVLQMYEEFLVEIDKYLISSTFSVKMSFSKEQVVNWVDKIIFLSFFFKKLYKKVKPQKLIYAGYYAWDDLYASIYTANELGITTIDYQHGPQINHMVFSSWLKHPKDGYNLMPNFYWCWDSLSMNNINAWAKKSNKEVLAKRVGHTYLDLHKKRNNKLEHKEFKPVIFYSLQAFSLEEMVPNSILRTIRETDYTWVFRLHPRSVYSIVNVQKFLQSNGVSSSSFEIHEPTSVPVYSVLASSFLHVTCFSGCLLEAQLMGVTTILIHPMGKEMFQKYLSNTSVHYLNSKLPNFKEEFIRISSIAIKDAVSCSSSIHNPFD